MEPVPAAAATPTALAKHLDMELKKWSRVISQAGIRMN